MDSKNNLRKLTSWLLAVSMITNSMSLNVLADTLPTIDSSTETVSEGQTSEREPSEEEEVVEGTSENDEASEEEVTNEDGPDEQLPSEADLNSEIEVVETEQIHVNSSIEETPVVYTAELGEILEVTELPDLQTTANPISFLGDGLSLKEGNYEKWIDRLANLPDYAKDFYAWLEENSDNDSSNNALIESTEENKVKDGEYAYLITSFTDTVTYEYIGGQDDAESQANAEAAAEKAISESISTNGSNMVSAYTTAIYSAFDRDHPEVFWLLGKSLYGSEYIRSYEYHIGTREGTTYSATATYTQYCYFYLQTDSFDIRAEEYQDVTTIQNDIYERDSIVAEITAAADGSRKEQLQYINNWLTTRNCYNSSSDLNNINHDTRECIGALRGKTGTVGPVCEGYARAFKVLCDKLGIPCVLVDGYVKKSTGDSEAHMWNYVQMDDENWYAVDVTWNDPSLSGSTAAASGAENEDWLLVGSDTIVKDTTFIESHPVSNTVTVGGLSFTNGPVLAETAYGASTSNLVASGTCGENLTWELSKDGILTVSGKGTMTNYSKKEEVPWYAYKDQIISATIEQNATSVGAYAFYSCNSLTEITLPEGLLSIGMNAFYQCSALESVTLPNSVISVGTFAFFSCDALTSVTIPNGITLISMGMFNGCDNLNSVTLPGSVTAIEYTAFYSCTSLTDVYFTGTEEQWNAVTIGTYNDVLSSAAIHFTVLGSGICGDNLTWTLTEDGVLTIIGGGKMDFTTAPWYDYRKSVISVIIGDEVSSIDDSAFHDCSNMTDIIIPESVRFIGGYAFSDCSSLPEIQLPEGITSIGNHTFRACGSLTSVAIPEGVTSIGKYAFMNCYKLTRAELPNTLNLIDDYAFHTCRSLTNVIIPNTVTTIGNDAFNGCGALTEIEFPKSVTSVGRQAFSSCDGLTSVIIPSTVTSIGEQAFHGGNLKEILVAEDNPNYCDIDGVLYNKDKTVLLLCPAAWNGTFVVPDGVTSIGSRAFLWCNSLNDVTISKNVISIGDLAFSYSSVTSLTVPDSVSSIGWKIFDGCSSFTDVYYIGTEDQWNTITIGEDNEILTSANIHFKVLASGSCGTNTEWTLYDDGTMHISGSGDMTDYNWDKEKYAPWHNFRTQITALVVDEEITSIGDEAFRGCTSLNALNLNCSVGDYSFYKCINLKELKLDGGAGEYAFCETGLEKASISGSLGEGALMYCPLYELEVGGNLGLNAVANCNQLTKVIFTGSTSQIGEQAFLGCNNLTDVYFNGGQAEWAEISIGMRNDELLDATIHFAIDTKIGVTVSGSVSVMVSDGVVPVVSVSLFSEDNTEITTMREDHTFRFENIPEGPYTLRLEAEGFVTREENVLVPTDDSVDIGELKLCKLGDVNMDGKITMLDFLSTYKYVMKNVKLDSYDRLLADITNDSKLTMLDFLQVYKNVME